MAKVVIALGGNALGNGPSEQKKVVKHVANVVVELAKEGHKIIICHGNGPQVGMINNAFSCALEHGVTKEIMPFAECGSMSQGYIGYHLQNVIGEELRKHNIKKDVCSIVTQTLVDKNDFAFQNPTKPIGPFLTEMKAKELANEKGFTIMEDAGRGWRRTVPSPKPIGIIEIDVISSLFDQGVITIAGGGGGVPVYFEENKLEGVDAVIDKDLTSAKLAELTNADSFLILTAVDSVKINFGKANEKSLKNVTTAELEDYIDENQFAPGSMLPKIEALVSFVKSTKKPAYIGELKDALLIINEKAGTKIIN